MGGKMAITLASLERGLKVRYHGQMLRILQHGRKHRSIQNFIKKVALGSKSSPESLLLDYGGQPTASFSAAQDMAPAPSFGAFDPVNNKKSLFRTVEIAHDALLAIITDESGAGAKALNSFYSETDVKVASVIEQTANLLELLLIGDGYAAIGTVSAVGTNDITLSNETDVKNFPQGTHVVFGQTKAGALRDSGDYLVVSGTDFDNKKITFTTATSNITGLTAGDYCFIRGLAANNSGARPATMGLAAYFETPSSGEDFLGQDRSTSPGKLTGMTVSSSWNSLENDIRKNVAKVAGRVESNLNRAIASPTTLADLANQVGSQIEYVPGNEVRAGYGRVMINTGYGALECTDCVQMGDDELYIISDQDWYIVHSGPAPVFIDNLDGATLRRRDGSPNYEIRGLSHLQLCCTRPGGQIRMVRI